MSPADGPAVYCGAIVQGELREELHATTDGIYARPQRRTSQAVSPWTTVERWRDVADATLIATEADLVTVLLRVPQDVRAGLLEAWRHGLRLRAAVRDILITADEYTVVEMREASA